MRSTCARRRRLSRRRASRPVRVGPRRVLALRRARRVGDASAGRAAGTAARAARRADCCDRRRSNSSSPPPTCTVPAPRTSGVGPRDRAVERPVDLQRRRRRRRSASAARGTSARARRRPAAASACGMTSATTSPRVDRSRRPRSRRPSRGRRDDSTAPPARPSRTSPPSDSQVGHERVGQPPGAAARARPADRVARAGSGRPPRSRVPARVRRRVAVHRRAVQPRARSRRRRTAAAPRPTDDCRQQPRELQRAERPRAGQQLAAAPPTGGKPASIVARTASQELQERRRRTRAHASPSPGRQRVERRGRRADVAVQQRRPVAVRQRVRRSTPPGAPTRARARPAACAPKTGDAAPAG